jgi:hypothetical protein
MLNKETLIEVKYNSEMNIKQKKLFENIGAKNKLVIKNIFDLEKLETL